MGAEGSLKRQAILSYHDGYFRVVQAGDHVVCVVTGERIPLQDLSYWSVSLQEPYATAEASLARYRSQVGK